MTKFMLSSLIVFFLFLAIAIKSIAAPGDLDPTFGNGGRVYPRLGTQIMESAADIVIQPDRKIVVVSGLTESGNQGLSLSRYLPNGLLDPTFGNDGKVYTIFSSQPYSYGQVLVLQPDGKYVVVGRSCDYHDCESYVLRYLQDGQLDPAFNVNGRLLISPVLFAEDIAVQQDGKIVVAGQSGASFTVARLNSDGSLDNTFGLDGKVTTEVGPYSWGRSIVLQPDSRIVVVGGTTDGTAQNQNFALVRYNVDGSLDSSFGNFGRVITSVQQNGSAVIALQPDNKLIVAGGTTLGARGVIMRFGSDGLLDPSFGGSGIVFDAAAINATGLVVQTNGKIVVAGPSGTYAATRYLASGARDSSFGSNGSVTTVFPDIFPPDQCIDYSGGVSAIAIQRDGKIVSAGTWSAVQGCGPWPYVTGEYPAIARYIGDSVPTSRALFDFDGDGRSDVSVFRPSDSVWYLNGSTEGFSASQFGLPTDKLVPADYDGDGKTDIAIFRDGDWWFINSSNSTIGSVQFGRAGDVPVPADYTGDGRAEIAIYRNGEWWMFDTSNGQAVGVQFGAAGDKPVPADYDGDGRADQAIYRNGEWHLNRSGLGYGVVWFGLPTDIPVVSDYDGDGLADPAVYRDGIWYLLGSNQGFTALQWGIATDIPVPGDYNGDGHADLAVYRNGIWYIYRGPDGSFDYYYFGLASDIPIPSVLGR